MPNFGGQGSFPFASGGGGGFGGGMPGGGRGGNTFHFSTSGGPNGFQFSDPESIFSQFFRSTQGGDDIPGFGGGGFGNMGGMGGPTGRGPRRTSTRGFDGPNGRSATPEITVLEKPMPVTLEEMFKGVTKRMKIKRKTFDPNTGKLMAEDRILEVPIKAGLKAGSKIKFKDVGDQVEGGSQDLHFIVEEVSTSVSYSDSVANRTCRNHIHSSLVTGTTSRSLSKSPSRKPSRVGIVKYKPSKESRCPLGMVGRHLRPGPNVSQIWECQRAKSQAREVTLLSVSTSNSQQV